MKHDTNYYMWKNTLILINNEKRLSLYYHIVDGHYELDPEKINPEEFTHNEHGVLIRPHTKVIKKTK